MSTARSNRSKLELAAYAGDDAARNALGHEAPQVPEDLWDWAAGLESWGHEPLVRACVALARLVLPHWEEVSGDQGPRRALEAAEAWLSCPCQEHARAAAVAEDAAKYAGVAFRNGELQPAAWGVADAAHAAAANEAQGILVTDAVESAEEVGLAPEQIRAAICQSILSWGVESTKDPTTKKKRKGKAAGKPPRKKVARKKRPRRR